LKVNQHFGGTIPFHFQHWRISQITNMKEATSRAIMLSAYFMFGLFFDPEDGGDILLRNVCWFSTNCMDILSKKIGLSTDIIITKQHSLQNINLLSIVRLNSSIAERSFVTQICRVKLYIHREQRLMGKYKRNKLHSSKTKLDVSHKIIQILFPETEISSIYCAQLNRFHVRRRQNPVFEILCFK
jgi:hypothetical protein